MFRKGQVAKKIGDDYPKARHMGQDDIEVKKKKLIQLLIDFTVKRIQFNNSQLQALEQEIRKLMEEIGKSAPKQDKKGGKSVTLRERLQPSAKNSAAMIGDTAIKLKRNVVIEDSEVEDSEEEEEEFESYFVAPKM